MTTEVERELCTICFHRNSMVAVPGRKAKVKCGGEANDHCPGFEPANNNNAGRRAW